MLEVEEPVENVRSKVRPQRTWKMGISGSKFLDFIYIFELKHFMYILMSRPRKFPWPEKEGFAGYWSISCGSWKVDSGWSDCREAARLKHKKEEPVLCCLEISLISHLSKSRWDWLNFSFSLPFPNKRGRKIRNVASGSWREWINTVCCSLPQTPRETIEAERSLDLEMMWKLWETLELWEESLGKRFSVLVSLVLLYVTWTCFCLIIHTEMHSNSLDLEVPRA